MKKHPPRHLQEAAVPMKPNIAPDVVDKITTNTARNCEAS